MSTSCIDWVSLFGSIGERWESTKGVDDCCWGGGTEEGGGVIDESVGCCGWGWGGGGVGNSYCWAAFLFFSSRALAPSCNYKYFRKNLDLVFLRLKRNT